MENINLTGLPKAKLIDLFRTLNWGKAGDTARTSHADYLRKLGEFSPEQIATAVQQQSWAVGNVVAIRTNHAPVEAPQAPAAPVTSEPKVQPKVIRTEKASKVFGFRSLSHIEVEIWDDPDAPEVDDSYQWDVDHLKFALLGLATGSHTWVWGAAGTGKTQFVVQLAARLGRGLTRINFDASAEKYEIIGGERVKNGSTVFVEGALLVGIQRAGSLILLDEITFCRPEHAASLHSILEDGGCITITETGQKYRPANGVCFIAADNTNGSSDGYHAGTRSQNPALLSRFSHFLKFEHLPEDHEAALINSRTGLNLDACKHLVNYLTVCRTAVVSGELEAAPCLRSTFAWARALHFEIAPRQAFDVTIAGKQHPDLQEPLQQLYKLHINEDGLKKAIRGEADPFGLVIPDPTAQPAPDVLDGALDTFLNP